MTVLSVRNFSAGYGKQPVVTDINITVEPGNVVALFGANGAGKSTTLMGISGALPILGGEVLIDGKVPERALYKRARAGLGYVTEERSVFKQLTVEENLRVGEVNIDEVLELFPELEKRLKIKAGMVSGGEQQMLSLARALARKPRLLLADELSLGLAPLVVTRLFEALKSAALTQQTGVLLVEQHVRKALRFVDYAYVLQRGKMLMSLPAGEAIERISEIESSYLSN